MSIQQQLQNFKGSQIIGLDTVTEVKLLGGMKNPMKGKITKMTEGSKVMIFTSSKGFKNMVNRRLKVQAAGELTTIELFETIAKGEFQPGPRQWGKRIDGTPFVEHKGKTYLECAKGEFQPGPRQWGKRIDGTPFVEHKGKTYLECIFLKPGKSTYYLDGQVIEKKDIIGLPEKKEGDQGGLKNKVIIRTFALDSIMRVRKSGQEIVGPAIS